MNVRLAQIGLAIAIAIALTACDRAVPASVNGIAFTDCRIKDFDSIARCTKFAVPEDRSNAMAAKTIEIHVAILPSLARRPEPDPVYFFAGGPGQAASDIGRIVAALGELRKRRDIVLVDQRGTGKSKTLTCTSAATDKNSDQLARSFSATDADAEQDLRLCVATLQGNAAAHRTDDYIDDLEAVRQSLGHKQINVWGGSYGSRVALRYMKRFPDSIRTATLDGVAPTSLRLPDDALASSATELRRLLSACAQSASCDTAFPDALTAFDRLLDTLKREPARVRIHHPASGTPFDAAITDRTLVGLLWPLLYQPESQRLVPALLAQAAAGNFAPLAATTAGMPSGTEDVASVLRMAVMCAEDMLGRSPASNPRFESIARLFYATCRQFPHGQVAPEFFEPTTSAVPTLLLSGNRDPVTPPSQAILASKTLARHKHVIVHGMGHIVSPHPCVQRVVGKFINSGLISEAADMCEAELKLPDPLFYVSTLQAKP